MPAASSSGKLESSWPVAGSIERRIPTSDIRTHGGAGGCHDLPVARAPVKRTPAIPNVPAETPLPSPPLRGGAPHEVGSPGRKRVAIEAVSPEVDAGRFPATRSVGEKVAVEADVFAHGQDPPTCVMRYRHEDESAWNDVPMVPLVNDRSRAAVPVP